MRGCIWCGKELVGLQKKYCSRKHKNNSRHPKISSFDFKDKNNHNWAYLAGLFDGEGCIDIPRGKNESLSLRIHIAVCHEKMIRRLFNEFNGAYFCQSNQDIRWKILWRWSLGGWRAKYFLRKILPYSIIKKEQILLAIKFPFGKCGIPISEQMNSERLWIRNKIKEYKEDNQSRGLHKY